jgi:hypothetical protein
MTDAHGCRRREPRRCLNGSCRTSARCRSPAPGETA